MNYGTKSNNSIQFFDYICCYSCSYVIRALQKPARYKIVEVTHANGEVDYTIKTSSFPFYFLWVTVEEDYGLYSVRMKGVESIERAKEFISKYEESDRKERGKRVINRRNVN